jgi:hypothetical protein
MRNLAAILFILIGFMLVPKGTQGQTLTIKGDSIACVGTTARFVLAGYDTSKNCTISWFIQTSLSAAYPTTPTQTGIEDTVFTYTSATRDTLKLRALLRSCTGTVTDTIDTIRIIFYPATVLSLTSYALNVCDGSSQSVTASVTSGSRSGCNIRWQKLNTTTGLWEASSNNATKTFNSFGDEGSYRAIYSCGTPSCDSFPTNTLEVGVYEPSDLELTDDNLLFCVGDSVFVSSTDNLAGRATCDTNWRHRNTPTGIWDTILDRSRLKFSTLADTGFYQAFYTCGTTGCDNFISDIAHVQAYNAALISIDAITDTLLCGVGTMKFHADTSGGNHCAIKWEYSLGSATTWTAFGTGKDTVGFRPPNNTLTARVRAQFDCTAAPGCLDQISNILIMQFYPPSQLQLTSTNLVFCLGDSVFVSSTDNLNGRNTCDTNWRHRNTVTGVWDTILDRSRLKFSTLADTGYYQAFYTCGTPVCDNFSSDTLFVKAYNPATITITATTDTILCSAGTVRFSADTTGGNNCNIKWEYSLGLSGAWTQFGTGKDTVAFRPPPTTIVARVRAFFDCTTAPGCFDQTSNVIEMQFNAPVSLVTLDKDVPDDVCTGANVNLTATVSAGGAGTCNYIWQDSTGGGTWVTALTNTSSTRAISGLSVTTAFRVIYACSASGCGADTSNVQRIRVNVAPSVNIVPDTIDICQNGSVSINSNAQNGTSCTIRWYSRTSGQPWALITGFNSGILALTSIAVDTYVKVEYDCAGSNCGSSRVDSVLIRASTPPAVDLTSVADTICTGGSYVLRAQPNTSLGTCELYWQRTLQTPPTTQWVSFDTTSVDTLLILPTLDYYYRVVYACSGSGCSNGTSAQEIQVVVQNQPPFITLDSLADRKVCAGGGVTINVLNKGGGLGCALAWATSNDNTVFTTVTGNSTDSLVLTNLQDTTWVKVTYACDPNGCGSFSQTVRILVNPQPNVNLTIGAPSIICPFEMPGMATANASGGFLPYTYIWDTIYRGNTYGNYTTVTVSNTTNSVSFGVLTDTMFVRATLQTQGAGCIASVDSSEIIVNPPPPTTTYTIDSILCAGGNTGAIRLNRLPGLVYALNENLPGLYDTVSVFPNLGAGISVIYVKDPAYNCLDTIFINLVESSDTFRIDINIVDSIQCFGFNNGIISAGHDSIAGVVYHYQWSKAPILGPRVFVPLTDTTQTIQGLDDGIYKVRVTSTAGCQGQDSATIYEPLPLVASAENDTVPCTTSQSGKLVAVADGGTAPYSYIWNDPQQQTVDSALGLTPGLYRLKVTDANNCTVNVSASVIGLQDFRIAFTDNSLGCGSTFNGIATITLINGAPPYDYTVRDAQGNTIINYIDTAVNQISVQVGDSGTYTIVAYDSLSCLADTSGRISIPPPIIPPVLVSTPDLSGTGTGTAIAFGDYDSYLWSNGQTNDTARGLHYGTHTVTVTDENGCTYVDSIEVGLIIGINEPQTHQGITLMPCRPNPFQNSTVIPFSITGAEDVQVIITDITGREVSILLDKRLEPGDYNIDFDGKGLGNGMYFCRLKAGEVVLRQKMILLR